MSFEKGDNGQNSIRVVSPDGSSIVVMQLGAHVTSWKTADGAEQLYTSPKAIYDGKTAIRGGVPLIFPQFSDMGSGPVHGIARVRPWELVSTGNGTATFVLKVRENDAVLPGTNFDLYFTADFSNTELRLKLRLQNHHATNAFSFNVAFHTYFRVSNIQNLQVTGLDRYSFANNLEQRRVCEPTEIRTIDREVDRIYFNVANPVVLSDSKTSSSLVIAGQSLPDVVLWNPWIEKAKKMSKDLPEEGYNDFVCVEHGQIQDKIEVAPGKEWTGSQEVVIKTLSSKI